MTTTIIADDSSKNRYHFLNNVLITLTIVIAVLKALSILGVFIYIKNISSGNPYFLTVMYPVIAILSILIIWLLVWIIKGVVKYRQAAYQTLGWLGVVSLLQSGRGFAGNPDWSMWLDLILILIITILAFFLNSKLFPKTNQMNLNQTSQAGQVPPTVVSSANIPPVVELPKKKNWVKILIWIVALIFVVPACLVIIGVISGSRSMNISTSGSTSIQSVNTNSGWVTYNSDKDKFGIMLPTDPMIKSENGTTTDGIGYTYDVFASGDNTTNVGYIVSKYIYSSNITVDASSTNKILGSMLSLVMKDYGKLIKSDFAYFGSYQALDFIVEKPDSLMSMSGRIIMVGQTPYLIFSVYPTNHYNDSDYQKFISSFKAS